MADYDYDPLPAPTREELIAAKKRSQENQVRALAFMDVLHEKGVQGMNLVNITWYGLGINRQDILIAYQKHTAQHPDRPQDRHSRNVDIADAFDGETVLLDPANDPYAISAIYEYANVTNNRTLLDWLRNECAKLERTPVVLCDVCGKPIEDNEASVHHERLDAYFHTTCPMTNVKGENVTTHTLRFVPPRVV